jgi:UDP-N-acetylmuramoyl-tripeptide--D-alanyl-D-alanine ligase
MLAGLPGRRIAVLGEMLELGKGSVTGHREVGTAAAATSTCSSSSARAPSGSPRARGPPASTPRASSRRAIARPRSTCSASRLRDGDVVLVKASRGVELDLLVDALGRSSR